MSNLQKLIENGGKVAIAYSSLIGNVYKTDTDKEKLAKIVGVLAQNICEVLGTTTACNIERTLGEALQQAEKIAGE